MPAKLHSSPLSFSNSTYLKLFLLTLILTAVVLVGAAVFVYYPVSITAKWVNPPVVFTSQGVSQGVSVTLYDDNTRADVEVTSPGVLVRTRRTAFIWDDYSDNPFTSGRLTTNTGGWEWIDQNQGFIRIRADGQASSWGGERVAYYSGTQIPTGTSLVYVLVKERHITTYERQYSGITMIGSSTSFYTLEYRRGTGTTGTIEIWRYTGSWSQLDSTILTLYDNTWYIFLGTRDLLTQPSTQREIRFTVYDSLGNQLGIASRRDGQVSVAYLGVGIYDTFTDGNYITAEFDDFVACANANPRFVNVTGLTPGWTVYLKDRFGNTVDSATAGSSGVVSLNVLTKPIIRDALFEIKYGNIVILPPQSFSEVVGGDVYECRIRDMNILGFRNQDSKPYNVYVKVEDLRVPSGYSGSINLWIGPGMATTPIQIVGNTVYQGTTSTITLGTGVTNYIHGTFSLSPSPSTPVELTLSFHYYLDGVEVEYPVRVIIHRGSGTLGSYQTSKIDNTDENKNVWFDKSLEVGDTTIIIEERNEK